MEPALAHSPAQETPTEAPAETPPARRRGYIARSWRGELSLARAFFVNGVLLTLGFALVMIALLLAMMIALSGNMRAEMYLWLAVNIVVFALGTPISVWQLVGLWRSASRHLRLGGRRIFAYGAYALVVALAGYEVWDAPSIWQEYKKAQLLLALEEAVHTDFAVFERDGVLSVSGLFGQDMVDKVKDELDRNPNIRAVHLTSVGGFIDAGQKVAGLIKERGLATYVSDYCKSSCTFAFLAGRERWLGPNGRLGFHSAIGTFGDDEAVRAMSDIYARLGMPAATIARVMRVSPKDMWEPSISELKADGLIDDVVEDPLARLRRVSEVKGQGSNPL
jgi:hypothetical protein